MSNRERSIVPVIAAAIGVGVTCLLLGALALLLGWVDLPRGGPGP